ncbi:MAG TPA: hypothetical protein VFM80_07840, partial [Gracilimonas sp.]|uniref:hypothetical protein n=1 Tax=Gracilimonas sp. TaxID=1974203 RepID=UPI002D903DCB|nr:hypothetical protein [Gracilimonas sp.]
QLVQRIQSKEEKSDIEPGRRIHEFELGTYTLRLDCDITKNYRITVSLGNERIYSFTIFAEQHDYEKLETAYSMIFDFLMTEQSLQKLPNNDLLKGFYFGSRSS